ncbi:MAG: 50S ribosomal protein L3 [Candidatus Bathyarchaeota archaeon]|nr:50S ribosomal protein L3 [Candidatus Bathyarchaeota archaeon]MDH5732993.1 50S ribosomal protein L3 [Candidatus Bathyarchaeota archaeon]
MGHRKKHAPKRGSLAYLPRGRAASQIGRIRFWPTVEEGPTLLGFMGFKAGMTHVYMIEDKPASPDFGKETAHTATILDTPPILICAIRAYTKTPYGLRTLTEAWMKSPPEDFNRLLTIPESFPENFLTKIEEDLEKIAEFRLLASTQPRLAGIPKKKPDLMEIKIDGRSINDQFTYAKELLGKTISVLDVFKEGQLIDAISVTKGKGWQGPVKRWGVRILSRKSRKTKRGVAVLGAWHPTRVLYTVPRAGQMGYHQRTEYNKRILKIGTNGNEVTPKGGFLRYGPVKGIYLLIDGSLPGPAKRLIRLRYPARPPRGTPEVPPKITQISLASPQG